MPDGLAEQSTTTSSSNLSRGYDCEYELRSDLYSLAVSEFLEHRFTFYVLSLYSLI